MAEGYDANQLMEYLQIAQSKTKHLTNLIRNRWDKRAEEFGLIEIDIVKARQESDPQKFINELNKEMAASKVDK